MLGVHKEASDWIQRFGDEWPAEVCPDDIVPAFRDTFAAMADLAKYGRKVFNERMRCRLTGAWWAAFTATQSVLVVTLDMFLIIESSGGQINYARNHVASWERACDVKLWRTVCGRSHAVPADKIDALREGVKQVRDFLDNKDLH